MSFIQWLQENAAAGSVSAHSIAGTGFTNKLTHDPLKRYIKTNKNGVTVYKLDLDSDPVEIDNTGDE